MVWHPENSGTYSVRSGYRLLNEDEGGEGTDAGTGGVRKLFWRKIWKSKVPKKVKVLLWRIYCKGLPVMINLEKRQLCTNCICIRCGGSKESILHAIRDCPCVSKIWEKMGFWWNIAEVSELDVTERLIQVCQKADQNNVQVFMITVWAIWGRRNRELCGEGRANIKGTEGFIRGYIAEYKAAQELRQKCSNQKQKWCPPKNEEIKVNFDGAINQDERSEGIGIAMRDKHGAVVAALAAKMPNVDKADLIEANAAVRSLGFAYELGFTRIVLEGEAFNIIKQIQMTEEDLSPIGPVIDEARVRMKMFPASSLRHTMRPGNQASHLLAKYGTQIHEDVVWIEEVPDMITSIIQTYCNC